MKKADKIAGIVSIILILATVIYLIKTNLVAGADNQALYVVGGLIAVVLLVIISHYLIIGLILKKRIKDFKKIAEQYSLQHSSTKNFFFVPYGKLNTIEGNIKGHNIQIIDGTFKSNIGKMAEDIVVSSVLVYTPDKSYNMDTKIVVDGKNMTPDYSQKWVMYRDPFMNVSEIKKYLANL